jgi:hypothetical protein
MSVAIGRAGTGAAGRTSDAGLSRRTTDAAKL